MYKHTLNLNIAGACIAVKEPIEHAGIKVYVDTDPDVCGYSFKIDPADTEGIKIFREFASKMAAHYNTLKK